MSEPSVRKTYRTVFKSQARQIISNVYEFMKKEAINNHAEKITDARWRTSQAVGASESTVTRILREKRKHSEEASTSSAVFRSPMKRRKAKPRKINLDEFDIGVVRHTIQICHTEYNQFPTLLCLKNVLKERIQLECCSNTLRKLLHKLGFKWGRTESNRKVLIEKHDIKMLRLKYLKQIKTYRKEGRPIVFTGESYIHTNHVQNNTWSKKDYFTRIIIVHAGSAEGFIPNALLTYKAETSTGDYHDNINTDIYQKWLEDKLMPNLPPNAVLVMDNAAYHNTISEKIPTSNSNNLEMQSWLKAKNISLEQNLKKVELYDLILKNKENLRRYKLDDILKNHGFSVLRLPPLHPELNPIENIWGIAKQYVASQNTGQNFTTVMQLVNESFEQITNVVWASMCKHVENIEDEYLKYFDLDINCMINVCDTSDSESNVSECSDD